MSSEEIIYKKESPLAFISFNRPDMRNAFTTSMLDGLHKALLDADEDRKVKVIIIRGEGGAFCAGANIMDMLSGKLSSWDMKYYLSSKVQKIPLLLQNLGTPVIASVDGPAYGGGFDLALACDFRIASERATFCSTVVRIGLAPGGGGAYFLPRLIGISKALELLLTGKVLNMDQAQEMGLVDRVVPPEKLEPETRAFAMEIAQWSIDSIIATKKALYHALSSDLASHLEYMSSQLGMLTQTNAHKEAIRKLAKKL